MKTLLPLEQLKEVYIPRRIIDKKILSPTQKLMLRCLLKGHGAYSKEYIRGLSYEEKRKIIYRGNTAHQVLNEARQIKLNKKVLSIVSTVFPDLNGNASEILTKPVTDRNFQCNEIKSLFLTQEETIEALLKAKLLPEDFYQL